MAGPTLFDHLQTGSGLAITYLRPFDDFIYNQRVSELIRVANNVLRNAVKALARVNRGSVAFERPCDLNHRRITVHVVQGILEDVLDVLPSRPLLLRRIHQLHAPALVFQRDDHAGPFRRNAQG